MRKGGGKSKGGSYERELCKRLSLWWTDDENDHVFWRSSTSGGRATVRQKKGKATKGQYGDMCVVDPIGLALLEVITWEFKTGYKGSTIQDLLDNQPNKGATVFAHWVQQVIGSAISANSYGWALVVRRLQRKDMIYIHTPLFMRLCREVPLLRKAKKQVHIITRVPNIMHKKKLLFMARDVALTGILLDTFLLRVKRKHIKKIATEWKRECSEK